MIHLKKTLMKSKTIKRLIQTPIIVNWLCLSGQFNFVYFGFIPLICSFKWNCVIIWLELIIEVNFFKGHLCPLLDGYSWIIYGRASDNLFWIFCLEIVRLYFQIRWDPDSLWFIFETCRFQACLYFEYQRKGYSLYSCWFGSISFALFLPNWLDSAVLAWRNLFEIFHFSYLNRTCLNLFQNSTTRNQLAMEDFLQSNI